MSACTFAKQVQEWHDGELKNENLAALYRHLAECEPCRSLVADLQKLRIWAQQAQVDFPSDLDRQLFQAWSEQRCEPAPTESSGSFWRKRIAIPVTVFAAMLLLILASFFTFGRFWEQQKQRPVLYDGHDMISSLTFALPAIEVWSDGSGRDVTRESAESRYDDAAAIQPPRPLSSIVPVYPDIARQYGLEGQVTLLAQVDAGGEVSQIQVVQNQAAGQEFVEKARTALQRTRFQSGRQYGRAISSWIMIRYVFHNRKPSATQEFIEQFI
jgi:TonB family protein